MNLFHHELAEAGVLEGGAGGNYLDFILTCLCCGWQNFVLTVNS